MKAAPVIVVVDPEAGESPAVQRGAALARASGATLHLCVFDHDRMVDLAAARVSKEVAERARRDFIGERIDRLKSLAAEFAGVRHPVEIDALWAPKVHEAILAKALKVGAGVVIKDAHHDSAIRRALFTPLDRKLARLLPCELWLCGAGGKAQPERIVAAVDVLAEAPAAPGVNRQIVATALRVGEFSNAVVDVASVFPFFPVYTAALMETGAMYDEARASFQEAFEKFMQELNVPEEHRHRLTGYPPSALQRFVEETHADLLVIGATYRHGLERLLLGSNAEAMINQVGIDMLLVKEPGFAATLSEQVDLERLAKEFGYPEIAKPAVRQLADA